MIAIWFRLEPLNSPSFLSPKFSFDLKDKYIPVLMIIISIIIMLKEYINKKKYDWKYAFILLINISCYIIGQYYLTLLPGR